MGFYIRKAVKVGPLRFNLSKSGVGVSGGVKGLRLGTGPRGNYVHMGRGGLYFRKYLNAPSAGGSSRQMPVALSDGPVDPTVGPMHAIESGPLEEMVDSSSAELLQELADKRKKARIAFWVGGVTVLVALVLLGSGAPIWVVPIVLVLGVAGTAWAATKDALRKTTVILYELEPQVEEAYESLHSALRGIQSCNKLWRIDAQGQIRDSKYHAGANTAIRRNSVTMRFGQPPFVKTNVEVPLLPAGRSTLAFMPDRLLVFATNAVGAVPYESVRVQLSDSNFVEAENVPRDATVVGTTWKYVNKSGGPDKRFKDNRQIPICAYVEAHLQSDSGLNEVFQLSKRGSAEPLRPALGALAKHARVAEAAG